jgi:mannose-6-phosphate isomerase-like protein (cupin superfamily)
MHIKNAKTVDPLTSENGEIIYELIGHVAGGTAAYSLAHISIPPGKASRKHYHSIAEESYHVLSGTGRLAVDGETVLLGPGDAVAILPDQVHQIFNAGETDLVLAAICVPAWTPDNSVYLD